MIRFHVLVGSLVVEYSEDQGIRNVWFLVFRDVCISVPWAGRILKIREWGIICGVSVILCPDLGSKMEVVSVFNLRPGVVVCLVDIVVKFLCEAPRAVHYLAPLLHRSLQMK